MNSNTFELATRQKVRFSTTRGNVGTEDLWDLSLEDLDVVAQGLYEQAGSTKKSFIKKKDTTNRTAALKLDVVVFIINTKMEEEEKRRTAVERKAKRTQLMELIAKKQDDALSRKSIATLQAELDKLDDGDEAE